jgi:hypothetical protein
MSWLLDPGGKSVAHRAQKVVSDMHTQMEKQNRHIQDLEQIVVALQGMCTGPMELEIMRLEKRKEELQRELEATDELITTYKKNVLDSKLHVAKVLNREKQFTYRIASHSADSTGDYSIDSSVISDSGDSLKSREHQNHHSNFTHSSHHHSVSHYSSSHGNSVHHHHHDHGDNGSSGDEMFEEEFELLASIKLIEPRLLFMIHRNTSEDIILYVPPQNESENTIGAYRIKDHTDRNSNEELSYFEKMMAYGPKVIPNHDRDEPNVREMIYSGATVCDASSAMSTHSSDHMGDLVFAMELPVVQDVRLDVWKASKGDRYWATTTIEGVKFAVLERIYVITEVRWGFPTVVGIELAGRHPMNGKVLTEMVHEVST